jgi:acyl-CoA thioester hydrolase
MSHHLKHYTPPPFYWDVRIYFEDTDAGGIVYHANYLRYMDRCRTEWLRQLGYDQQKMCTEQGLAFVMRHTDLNYFAPARLDDQLRITFQISHIGKTSIAFTHEMWRLDHQQHPIQHINTCIAKLVLVSWPEIKPTAFPESLLCDMSPYIAVT